jgi:hypothetical protein
MQLLQLEQHCQHAFELSVEMNLVAREAFKSVGIDGLTICLITDLRSVIKLQFSPLAVGISAVGRLVFLVIARLTTDTRFRSGLKICH